MVSYRQSSWAPVSASPRTTSDKAEGYAHESPTVCVIDDDAETLTATVIDLDKFYASQRRALERLFRHSALLNQSVRLYESDIVEAERFKSVVIL